jgi:hypothetical protein
MATNILDKPRKVASSLLKGALRVIDPSNVDSQVERGDLKNPESQPAVGDEKELISLGEERFEESRMGRWSHNGRAFSGIAMFQGRQQDYWDEDAGEMMPLPGVGGRNPDFEERMTRSKWNIIRRTAEGAVARIMAAAPDSWAAPESDSEEDKQAAQIMRSVNAHCGRTTHRQEMLEEAALVAYISTTCFIECGWDNKAWASVGFPKPDGSVEYKKAQIGDVCNHLMLCIDAYPDPNASLANGDIHNGAYFIKRCTRSLEYIQHKWGKTVAATSVSSNYGFLEQRLEWIAGDRTRDMAKVKHCTDVTEVWEKPSERYPQGRFWVYSADKTLLWAGEWPYKNPDGTPYADRYPFVPVKFQKNQASIWGLNGVDDLKPIQIDLNDLASYLRGRLQWDRPTEYVSDKAQIAPEALLSPALGRTVSYHDRGEANPGIEWVQPPAPPAWLFTYWDKLIAQAEYISGIHDFNSDSATPPTSGFEFELRVEQEKARLARPIRNMEEVMVQLQEWDGAFYRQFGSQFPRVLGLDDKGNPGGPDAAASALVDLRALKNGNFRVILQPGSGQSKSPAAQEQRLDEMMKILAQPGMNPPLAKMYLSLSSSIRSDKQTDDFNMEFAAYFAAQAQQQQSLQAMKGQQAQGQQEQKTQAAQVQAQIDQQTAEAEAAIRVHAEMQVQAARSQADQNVEANRAKQSADLENLKFSNAIALQEHEQNAPPTFSVSMPIKPGANATQSAEKAMGFTPDTPEQIKQANTPPPPAGAPPKPKSKVGS